jgi:sarcosine oxidase gamma subunit
MLLHQLDDGPGYDIYVHRSFAIYAWSWLADASREYGLSVRSTRSR